MQTDELRAELAELAREVDPFPEDLAAIRHRVARRRALLGSIAVVVSIALVVAVVTTTRSASHIQVAGREKEIETRELPRLDAIVVLPSQSTDADAAHVRAILDSTGAVDAYAPLPASIVVRVLGLGGNDSPSLRARMCADPSIRSYGVVLSRTVQNATRDLTSAIGITALVQPIGKQGVDVEVFMEIHASGAQVAAVRARIASDADIAKSTFIDRQTAFREFKRLFHDEPALIEGTKASDLPVSFRLEVREGASPDAVAQRFEDLPGVQGPMVPSTDLWTHPAPEAPSGLVEIFMQVRASAAEIAAVRTALAGDTSVESFQFFSKADAFAEFKRMFGDDPTLIERTAANALPTSFSVTLRNPNTVSDFEPRYRPLAGVQVVNTSATRGALGDACAPNP